MSVTTIIVLASVCSFVLSPVYGKPFVPSVSRDLPDLPLLALSSDSDFQEKGFSREGDNSRESGFPEHGDYVIRDARIKRQAVMNKTRIWPNGIVPYVLDKQFTSDVVATIEASMREVEQNIGNSSHPCVTFIPRTTEIHYLDAHTGTGCSSVVGLDFTGPQVSTFSPLCAQKGLLLHELLHTLGIYHEQDRFDRDEFISMNATNLRTDAERNYVLKNINEIDILGTSYDFTSIMHYGPYSFPKDPKYPVMTPKPKYASGTYMGQRFALSRSDVLRVQRLYNCPEDISHMQSDITEDKILFWCDFESSTCDFAVTTSQPGLLNETQDNNGSSSSTQEANNTLWVITKRAKDDGPKTGTTNGLDPFFYASQKIQEEKYQDPGESNAFPFDTTPAHDLFKSSIGDHEESGSQSTSPSPLTVSTDVSLTEIVQEHIFVDYSTQESSVADISTQESSASDIWTQEPPVTDLTTQESTTIDKQTQESTTIDKQTQESTTIDKQTQESTTIDKQTQESTTIDKQTQESTTIDKQTQESSTIDKQTQESTTIDKQTQDPSPTKNSTHPTTQAPTPTLPSDKRTVSLTTPIFNTGDMCLDLRLFQGGPSSFLEMYVKGPLFKRARFFTREGSYTDHWLTLKLSLPMISGVDFQLEIVTVIGEGSVALDDVHILKGLCL